MYFLGTVRLHLSFSLIEEGGVDLDSTQLPTTVMTDGITDHAFLVIYRSDSQVGSHTSRTTR